MPDETMRRYLFVAIDRATRWVFMHIYGDMTDSSSIDFLHHLKLAAPIKISKILTDNGSQFADCFTTKDKKPDGKHAFDVACAALPAEHRLALPRHFQTNGMVERFNELLQQTRFDSRADLHATLLNYLNCTITTFRSVLSTVKLPSWPSKNGKRSGLNYSSSAFMIKRDSTPNG